MVGGGEHSASGCGEHGDALVIRTFEGEWSDMFKLKGQIC